MKFVVLMSEVDHYAKWAAQSDTERQEFFDGLERFTAAVQERGAVLAGEALSEPARRRRLEAGPSAQRSVTDGPYAESVEQVGGLFLVELPDEQAAIETCRLLPDRVVVDLLPVDEMLEEAD